MKKAIVPLSWKDTPALIERLLPVQKLSAEAYKEQMAVHGKTLTALGSYWKGRKPLILNKACILGCLLPATDNPARDLEVFEMLMGMDDASFVVRAKRRAKPKEIVERLSIACIADYFTCTPEGVLPASAPVDWTKPEHAGVKVAWRADVSEGVRRRLEAQLLPRVPYRKRVDEAYRPEEVMDEVHVHIWDEVNTHLGTEANSFPELVEQIGMLRFGHRPRFADTFCGSGQIPFEAARLGCDVYASDLNPVACMLTWGAFHIVGADGARRLEVARRQEDLIGRVRAEIDRLGIETDSEGWRIRACLYCAEVRCPQSGWRVPLLPTRVVSKRRNAIAELAPDPARKRYDIIIRVGASETEMMDAQVGTIGRDGNYGEPFLVHSVAGVTYKTKLSTLRGDYEESDGSIKNRVRPWEKADFCPRHDDLFQERLYAVQWVRPCGVGRRSEYDIRSVTDADLLREDVVHAFVKCHIKEWQANGWIPDMQIEVGGPPRYQGQDLVRARGWTHWHHAFNARQLLLAAMISQHSAAAGKVFLCRALNRSAKLSRWDSSQEAVSDVFYNQALNTLFNYGCRGLEGLENFLSLGEIGDRATNIVTDVLVQCHEVTALAADVDFFVTDPPYGDAVKYEEILDFFVAWLRKDHPPEFAKWTWDSRRVLAVQGEGESFRRGMVAAYKRMTECMPDNGIQVIMFTHQSGSLWADMANIVWASGLQVTAAWYVVTETESALREGSHVKGTVLLVLRKRLGSHKTSRDDLAWEIQEEVEKQVADLTGLNQQAKGLYRDANVFEDSDIQMAGYAAALRVLTRYAIIDGRDMTAEAIRPRVRGETTFVDGLITFAVDTANQCLVPQGVTKPTWDKLSGAERFYLKLIDMEARGAKTLDNYQNFAKAFKVADFKALLASHRANDARLKSAAEFGRAEMSDGSELHQSVLRAVLYALMELQKDVDGAEVLAHLTLNLSNYYGDMVQRERVVELADYLAQRLASLRPDEAGAARVLRELVKNQRLG